MPTKVESDKFDLIALKQFACLIVCMIVANRVYVFCGQNLVQILFKGTWK